LFSSPPSSTKLHLLQQNSQQTSPQVPNTPTTSDTKPGPPCPSILATPNLVITSLTSTTASTIRLHHWYTIIALSTRHKFPVPKPLHFNTTTAPHFPFPDLQLQLLLLPLAVHPLQQHHTQKLRYSTAYFQIASSVNNGKKLALSFPSKLVP
jgi:hypothetical protein